MDRVIIFGCGPTGLRTYRELKADNEVVAFLDNDEQKDGTVIEGVHVYKPSGKLLADLDYNYIVIASVYGKWQIREQLYGLGITDERIRMYMRRSDVLTPFLRNLAWDFREENIAGACAEVGVFRGESAKIINHFFGDRKLHLFDTFEGFAPSDVAIEHNLGRQDVKEGQFCDTSVELVMNLMEYPGEVIIHKGIFPDTAKSLAEQFCFVRIDMDLYAPTAEALKIFSPLMSAGGVILIHDYFGDHYPAIKKVVREFVKEHPKLRKIPIGDEMSIAITGF